MNVSHNRRSYLLNISLVAFFFVCVCVCVCFVDKKISNISCMPFIYFDWCPRMKRYRLLLIYKVVHKLHLEYKVILYPLILCMKMFTKPIDRGIVVPRLISLMYFFFYFITVSLFFPFMWMCLCLDILIC